MSIPDHTTKSDEMHTDTAYFVNRFAVREAQSILARALKDAGQMMCYNAFTPLQAVPPSLERV